MCGHSQPLTIPTTCCNLQKVMANHCIIFAKNNHGYAQLYITYYVIYNTVNGRVLSKDNPSLSQDNHGEQVVPDCHQMIVQNKDTMKIEVWNVRTLYQCGKIENAIQEMK